MLEEREALFLSPHATLSRSSLGRRQPEEPCDTRTCFQRDTDRIVYSKAFRRLKHKTQVFLQPEGDHYRTRMTHTIEVSRIARTLGRALCLNEDLIEAAALGHDLGHTPFGHAGERALNALVPGGFRHNEQSLRVVDRLEKGGLGLNLTQEVRSGILTHSTGCGEPTTLEGMLVRIADKTAYINHDIDDSIRAGILAAEDIPRHLREILGESHSRRINTVVSSIIRCSLGKNEIRMDDDIAAASWELRSFLFENVYRNPLAKSEESKTINILGSLYEHYLKHLEQLPEDYKCIIEQDGAERAVCDYIAGMTDQYATSCFSDLFIPYAWAVR